MTWLHRHHLHGLLRNSVWLPAALSMLAALVTHRLVREVDLFLGGTATIGPEGARALLGMLAASMLTFIVFVFSILLVAVQLASAQLTPRVIAIIYSTNVIRYSLAVFVFAFTYSLAALSRIEGAVLQLSAWVAVYSCVVSIVVFLYMIDYVGKSLRPVSLLTRVGREGQEVIRSVYPRPFAGTEEAATNVALVLEGGPSRTVASGHTGVVLAFDVDGLVALARRADCLVELVPQVGDFVTRGDPLFRLYHGGAGIADGMLQQSVAIGPERTMEQDPQFAFRIIVDIAAKALSPAVNDPTTAVLALDQIHALLRTVANRQLDTGRIQDAAGQLRLAYRTPDWEDFASLATTEIRHYGRSSIQVVRRMRAMLENLIETVPPPRTGLLRAELRLISEGVAQDFRDPEDRIRASSADSLGVGGAPSPEATPS